MHYDTLIKQGKVYLPHGALTVDIGIIGEKIVALGANLEETADVIIDAKGNDVFPGGVDAHVHTATELGGFITNDNFLESTRAAAFGGTTTIVDFAIPEQSSGHQLPAYLSDRIHSAQQQATIDFAFHSGLTRIDDDIDEIINACLQLGSTSFKMFTVYPGSVMVTYGEMRRAFEAIARHGGTAVIHAEHQDLISSAIAREPKQNPASHRDSRDPLSEVASVSTVLALLKETGCPAYFVHISTQAAIAEISRYRAQGVYVGAETCPHYLTLDSSLYDGPDGVCYICSPPLRPSSEREALWKALAHNEIDLVSSDHCCYTRAQKFQRADNFTAVPNGLPGVETRMAVLYSYGVDMGLITPYQFQQLTSTLPSRWTGLYPQKGAIRIGSDADLVVWERTPKQHESSHMATDFLPFRGHRMAGGPRLVLSRGRLIVDGEEFLAKAGQGRYLARKPQF